MIYRKRENKKRDRVIGFKVNLKEKLEIERAAKAAGMYKSEFVYYCVYKEIKGEGILHKG